MYIRCMEHSLHIACKHFVEAIAPASPKKIRKKVQVALQKASEDGNLDLDKLDNALAMLDLENDGDPEDPDADDSEDEASLKPGDALGKALALVKQVCFPIFLF